MYVDQEAAVKIRHGIMDWFQFGKGVYQGCILSPCVFNFYAEYIMKMLDWMNPKLTGIKIARRNINNLRYADDTSLMAESEEKLKSSWWSWKRRVKKADLRVNIQKTNIMSSGSITSRQIEEEKSGNIDRFYFPGLQNHCGWWPQPWN